MDTNMIVQFCKTKNPAIVYLGVGCAMAPLQQYPPFLKDFPGNQICILIDPRLEEDAALSHERPDGVVFFHLRRLFEWATESDFIAELCNLPGSQFIAQDYSGADIREFFPKDQALMQKVLFDVTYGEGSCYVDFDAVRIFRKEDGGFVNPNQETLASMRRYVPHELLVQKAKERNIAIQFVDALYRIQSGKEEPRDWCTPDRIMWRAGWMFSIYGLPSLALEELLIAYMIDLAAIVDATPMSRDYVTGFLGSKDYIAMTGTLTAIITEVNENLDPR
jgi:hypothetical protein